MSRLGGLLYRRARTVLAFSVLILIAAALLGVGAFGKLQGGGFDDPAAASSRAAAVIDDHFGGQTNLVLMVHANSGSVDTPAVADAARQLTERVAAEPGLSQVASYWTTAAPAMKSRDGANGIVVAHIDGDATQVSERAAVLVDRYRGPSGPITVGAGGSAAVQHDVNDQVAKDLGLAESIAIPITLILLVLAFGSVVAALVPLILGVVAILGTFAELDLLGRITAVSVYSVNLTTALGLALGVDYALLLVARFREELSGGADVREAVAAMLRTAGRTIVFSATTVIAALAALLVFPEFFLRSFAYAGMGVVAVAAISALTVVPALLAVLGHRVNAWSLPWSKAHRGSDAPAWGRLAAAVTRRPIAAALPVVAILALVAGPLLGVGFSIPDERVMPAGAASRQVSDTLHDDFDGFGHASVDVVIDGPSTTSAIADYAARVSQLPGVTGVTTSLGTWVHGNSTDTGPAVAVLAQPGLQRLTVASDLDEKSAAASDLVRSVRAAAAPAGAVALVGGVDAQQLDTESSIGSRLPIAALMIVATTFALLFAFTGSVVQPLRALLLNALGLSAALGAMVWIFQDGHLSGLLGFTPRPTDTAMAVLLFCVAFGLSMDYEVILTSRIKELHDQGAATTDAVIHGLAKTGRIVSTAAGLLAVSFFAFGVSKVSFIQMFGLGTGLAILIDALLIRGILVPAAMSLLGGTNWYAPAPLRRLHRYIALQDHS
ncbi:MMPL family transporter [Nocardia sp. NPDC059239]|uniref:MMPL family transporter n=1 Tax=unclassified Nocardia TaxID=2637762 RepID=UPI0036BB6914